LSFPQGICFFLCPFSLSQPQPPACPIHDSFTVMGGT
jgi:hypothetical protein